MPAVPSIIHPGVSFLIFRAQRLSIRHDLLFSLLAHLGVQDSSRAGLSRIALFVNSRAPRTIIVEDRERTFDSIL